jgi:hypothetical protein
MDTTKIFNLALSACGVRAAVSSPDHSSREAEICRTWYGVVRDHILRAAPWPGTRGHARLAVLAERDFSKQWQSSDPEPTYRFAYGTPPDMLAPRYITDYSNFVLGLYNNKTSAIMCNSVDAILVYTLRQEDPNKWDTNLQMAIALGLGSFICQPLTGKNSRAVAMQKDADALILQARVSAANTDTDQHDSIPTWMSARGTALAPPATRFIYPYTNLLSAQGATDGQ